MSDETYWKELKGKVNEAKAENMVRACGVDASMFSINRQTVIDTLGEDAFEVVKRVCLTADRGGGVACVSGGVGSGKSLLLSACVLTCCRMMNVAKYRRMDDLMLEIKATFSGKFDDDSQKDVMSRVIGFPVLAIDNVFGDRYTGFEHRTLASILDRRISNNKFTVISTSMTVTEFRREAGQFINERIGASLGYIDLGRQSRRPNILTPVTKLYTEQGAERDG